MPQPFNATTLFFNTVFFPEPALGQTLNASEKTAVEEQGSNN